MLLRAITVAKGCHWQTMSNGSLRKDTKFVPPILQQENIALLQTLIHAIRHTGSKPPENTSMPVSNLGRLMRTGNAYSQALLDEFGNGVFNIWI